MTAYTHRAKRAHYGVNDKVEKAHQGGGGGTRWRVRLTQGVFERNCNVNFRLFAKKQTIVFNINALPAPPGSEVLQPHPLQLPSPDSSCSQSRVHTVGLI